MITRIAFAAVVSGLALFSANIALADVGNVYDVNKDGLVDDTDVDIVALHINEWGVTDDLEDAFTPFDFDDEDIEDLISFIGSAIPVLEDLANLGTVSSGDRARIYYVVSWERKDVNDSDTISAADALAIINYLNS